jgi:hypothetical protein
VSDCRCGRNCQTLDELIDCSEDAQNERRARLRDLNTTLYSLRTSISDRSRSVAYARQEIPILRRELMQELYFCLHGFWPLPPRRVYWIPLVKGL